MVHINPKTIVPKITAIKPPKVKLMNSSIHPRINKRSNNIEGIPDITA